MTQHTVYILASQSPDAKNRPVFIGETLDMLLRLTQHRAGRPSVPSFALTRLVYTESYNCPFQAKTRAKALKSASREWINALVSSHNPNWQEMMPQADEVSQAA